MNKDFDFRNVGIAPDFQELVALVSLLTSDDWNAFTFRQKTIVGHKDTLTVPLIYDYGNKKDFVTHSNYEAFKNYLSVLSAYLHSLGEPSVIQRANIVLLRAKSEIKRHKDVGEFLLSTRRMHIPVFTNDGCYLTVEDKKQHFKASEIWEIDNTGKMHSAHNEGDTDRVHLIIDTNHG